MKSGKTLTLSMTLHSFLTELWRNLFKEPRDYADSKILFDLRRKGEHWDWAHLDGTRISKRKVFLSKVYLLSLKLGRFFRRLRLKVSELQWTLQRFMVNLCGVLVLVCVILICVLLLPLYLIVSLAVMFLRG